MGHPVGDKEGPQDDNSHQNFDFQFISFEQSVKRTYKLFHSILSQILHKFRHLY